MDTNGRTDARKFGIDKALIQRIVAEQYRSLGLEPDSTATARKARELMQAQGVRAEDNLFSCGIIAARDEE